MRGLTAWESANLLVPAIAGALLFIVLLVALARRPSLSLALFLAYFLLGVLNLAGGLILPERLRREASFDLSGVWEIGIAFARLRYLFLLLFAHSLRRFSATPLLTVLMVAVAGFGIASSFFVYSILPELAEIALLLYVFAYLLAAYFLPGGRRLSRDRSSLLGPVLACSGFFLIGIVLDLVEEMPAAGVYVSAGFVDFSALYLLSVGGVVAFWALRGRGDTASGGAQPPDAEGRDALSSLPLTKREREIVGLMLGGETNAAIAERLFISESTVKKHVNNVFRKLGISSRWELLKLAGPPLRPKE